jgi:transcriptional regulator with GAF, ATPase, and Fis domain
MKAFMTQEILKRVLADRSEGASILDDFIHMMGDPIAVNDLENNLIFGTSYDVTGTIPPKHPILVEGEIVGWVSGGDQSELIAELLTNLVAREAEKEELLDEILDLYRQINLLFNLSEKLTTSLELETVAKMTLDEACRLIDASSGAVILFEKDGASRHIATMGQVIPAHLDSRPQDGIIESILTNASAEIINDVQSDPRNTEGIGSLRSMLYAPLLSKNQTMGLIVIGNQSPVTYMAADLSLLNTLASQAAPAIENAQLYEQTLKEAKEREEMLLKQVAELRIELDEVRQKEKVAEITGSEYYQRLRKRADILRSIIDKRNS